MSVFLANNYIIHPSNTNDMPFAHLPELNLGIEPTENVAA